MKLTSAPRYLYEPDGSGSSADPAKDDNAASAANTQKGVTDAVRAIADQFKSEIAALHAKPAPVAPTPAPAAPDLQAEAAAMATKFNDLVAKGEVLEAIQIRDQYLQRANALTQGDPADNPVIKTAIKVGERLARKEYPDIFDKWGGEVQRVIESLPIDQRIQPDAWDRAVSEVKTRHFDDIFNARLEEERKKFVPTAPSAPGSRGRQPADAGDHGLDEEQLYWAGQLHVSPERYAARLKEQEEWDSKSRRERKGIPPGQYPVLPAGPVTPGRF